MPIDIDLNDPVTSAGLALGGGAGVVGSIMTNNFLNNAKDDFVKWENDTKKLWRNPAYKSQVTGKWLQTSPEIADQLLDNYVNHAQRIASKQVGPFRWGRILGEAKLLPTEIKNIFRDADDVVDTSGERKYYRMFSDPKYDKGALKAHMLHMARQSNLLDDKKHLPAMRKAYDKLADDAKNILGDASSMRDKYNKLKGLTDNSGLKYFEDYVLGGFDEHPGIAKLVGGGIIGKMDPKTGVLTNEALHSGMGKDYMHALKTPFKALSAGNKLMLGAKGATAAVGLYGLGRILNENMNKSAASPLEELAELADNETVLGTLEAAAGGGLTTLTGGEAIEKLKQLTEDAKKAPNLNVGFTYGSTPVIGDGHKAPASHIRQILERYIESLPDGHELKGEVMLGDDGKPLLNEYGFARRKGGVQFDDLPLYAGGVSPNVTKDYNIIYNTGLGAVRHPSMDPNEVNARQYGFDSIPKLQGTTQTIKNYVTDTPQIADGSVFGIKALEGIKLPAPNLGAAAYGPGLPFDMQWGDKYLTGHGFYGANNEVLGYGPISNKILRYSRWPFIPGTFKNLAPDTIGTPFISPATLDKMNMYDTREKKLARFKEILDAWDPNDTSGDKEKLSKIYDAINNGKRVVTISGSGRGDYVGNRTAHLLDSLDRYGIDDVEVVSLMGGYTGAKDLPAADRKKLIDTLAKIDPRGRVTTFGRLANEPYTLIQQISDINLAATGQMGISEAANGGNVQFIPEFWFDDYGANRDRLREWQMNAWEDILTDKRTKKIPYQGYYRDIFERSTPALSNWNGGSLDRFPKDMPDVFKSMGIYKGGLREGARNYLRNWGLSEDTLDINHQLIDTDPVAELLLDKNRGKLAEMNLKATEAARRNRATLPGAQKALAEDMVNTLKENISRQKLKALPGAIGNTVGAGMGVYGMIDGMRRITNPNNYKLNLSL